MGERGAEVAVEGVDESLEGLLERGEQEAVGLGDGLPGQAPGRQAELPQVAQERREDAEPVGGGRDALREHERGVERGDVHVQDVARDPLLEDGGVAPRHRPAGAGVGNGPPAVEVLPQEERVDLGGVAPEDHRLVVEGQRLGLDEVGRGEDGRQRQRLQHVVARVGHEPRRLLAEDARDVVRWQIGAVRRRHAEMARHVLQAVGREVAGGHIVELGEDPRVHDVPAHHPVAAVGDGPLGHLHAGGMAAERRAVTAPREDDAVAPGAGLQVLEIEAEDVVPLEHVGIALANEPGALLQERGLGHLRARQDRAPARRVGHRDGDDPVGLARRVGELEARRRQHLDVHRHAHDLAEGHPAERRLPGPEQELVGRIPEEAVRGIRGPRGPARDFPAMVAGLLGLGP